MSSPRHRQGAAHERHGASTDAPATVMFLVRSLQVGGAQRQLVTLVRHLDPASIRVVVVGFYRSGGGWNELATLPHVTCISLDKAGRWDVIPFLVRLWRVARQQHPDVVHGWMTTPNLMAILAARAAGARLLWGIRASSADPDHPDWLVRVEMRLARAASSLPDRLVFNSEAGLTNHRARGFDVRRAVVIPNGIDTDRFRPMPDLRDAMRQQFGFDGRHHVFGVVARHDPLKDHATFLRAAAVVSAHDADARFVCVGVDPAAMPGSLAGLLEELGIAPLVHWSAARQDVAEVYSAFDVAVSSSVSEGFPNAIGEAMACGVPVAATDAGDSAQIVGDTGRVVPPGDPMALAAAMIDVATSSGDPAVRHRARARIVEHFGVARLGAAITDLLTSVASERRRSRARQASALE